MSKINCPECGTPISDNIKKCPKCRFPIEKFANPEYVPDETDYDFSDSSFVSFRPELTYSEVRRNILNRKILKYGGIFLIVAVIAVVAVIFMYRFNINTTHEADVLDIQNISAGRFMKINGKYVMILTSNEKRPFVSVVKDKANGIYNYVYMNDGRGEVDYDYIENEAGIKENADVVGYFSGYSLSEEDIDNVIDDYYYYDYFDGTYTACTVDYKVTLGSKISGILFYDVLCESEHESELNKSMVVIDGVGMGSCILDKLPYGTGSIEPEFKPLYFIPASELEERDYKVDQSFETNFRDYYDYEDKYIGYNIYGKVSMSDKEQGLLLYNYSLKSIGSTGYTEEKNGLANIESSSCTIAVSDSFICSEDPDLFDCYFNICAYVNWNAVPIQKEKTTE